MFNFKSRKQLKDEITSLEKQLEIREEQVKELEEEGQGLKDRKDHIELKYLEENKEVKTLRATLERRDGVIKILEQDLEEAKFCNETLMSGYGVMKGKFEKERKARYKAEGTIGKTEALAENAYFKIEQLREERRRSQENYGKYIKQLKKEKAEIKRELEDEIKTSDSLSWELRSQLEFFTAEGFKLELDEPWKIGKRKFFCDLGEPWAEEILDQMGERMEEKDKEIAKKDKKIERLKTQNRKLNDVILKSKGTDRVWANIAYVKE